MSTEHTHPSGDNDPIAPASPAPQTVVAHAGAAAPKKDKRTLGLWLVDTLIYPIVNNFGVFGISLAATYLTDHGWPQPANGKQLGPVRTWVGNFLRDRGVGLDKLLQSWGMSKKTAEMSRMVAYSFGDGTLVAPFVKVLEDRREKMALAIDTTLGTKPKDESVYDAEPKQTWRSVVEGRLLTSLVVVPTAVLLNTKFKNGKAFLKPNESLNDYFFNNPGMKIGEEIEKNSPKIKAGIEKMFGKVHLPTFFKIGIFEAFYTTVCTAGLYIISRCVARANPPKAKHAHDAHSLAAPTLEHAPQAQETTPSQSPAPIAPTTTARAFRHIDRVVQPSQTAELTT